MLKPNHLSILREGLISYGRIKRNLVSSSAFQAAVSFPVQKNKFFSTETFDFRSRTTVSFSSREKPLELHSIWLRHHCGCDSCFNSETNQRLQIPSSLPSTSSISSQWVEGSHLIVEWRDGHVSKFSLEWLRQNAPKSQPELQARQNHKKYGPPPDSRLGSELKDPLQLGIGFEDFMNPNSDLGVAHLLHCVLQYGFGLVTGCPVDFQETKKVILRVSHPITTIFGDFSEWTSDLKHKDTAYTSGLVHLHTDTSYFSEPAGLQIFHCLEHSGGSGGLNWLQDGFRIAQKIHREDPGAYQLLSEVPLPSQYLDRGGGHHFLSEDVTLSHDFRGDLKRLRYNPHDLAVLNQLPVETLPDFYKGLVTLSDLLERNPLKIRLSPGLIIFLDNWRTLHGRESFTGFRHLCGAYISRSDWLSKARTLGLLS